MKNNLLVLFFGLFLFCLPLTAQDFIFEEVPNPEGHEYSFTMGELNGIQYLLYFDEFFNQAIFAYDGETLSPVDGPTDLTFSFYIDQADGVMYLSFYDLLFNQVLVAFDGDVFTPISEPLVNANVGQLQFTLNDFVFFDFFDFFSFTQTLQYYDGNEMVEVPLPDDYTFGFTLGVLNDNAFIILYDALFNSIPFRFDGANFEELTLPLGTQFPFTLAQTDELIYMGLSDANFQNTMYTFDGVNWEEIPNPVGFQLGGYIGELQDEFYFFYYDNYFNITPFKLDLGTDLLPLMNPPGLVYSWNTGTTENNFYLSYYDQIYFQNNLVILNDVDGLFHVPNPPGYFYSNFETEWEDGALLTYYDDFFFLTLQYYADDELIEVPLPGMNYQFGDFQFTYGDAAYLYYFDNNTFENSLWKLTGEPNSLPMAEDNSVSTLQDVPYLFEIEDFNFVDLNDEDTLVAIQIIEIPSVKGILHLNGANLNNDDIISAEDIQYLTYVPFNSGLGTPWDSFLFRVYDGEDWSEETYTMLINVVEVLNTQDPRLANAMKVAPNPTTGYFQLEIENYTSGNDLQIVLMDGVGRVLSQQIVQVSGQDLAIPYDLSQEPAGLYYVLIRDGQHIATKKLMKQ